MPNIAMMVLLSVVVVGLLVGLFAFLGMRWHALTAGVVIYLLFGGFVAFTQYAARGGCPSWRTDGYWMAVVAWPGDFYVNVIDGTVSTRRYLIPRTCEVPSVNAG